jgi:secondary thiamine-phosphate synthase enzyme
MEIKTEVIEFDTRGFNQILDITPHVVSLLEGTNLAEGNVLVSAIGSTTGITTLEFEPGLVQTDVAAMFEQMAPYSKKYKHNLTWGDDNGGAHLRSALTGTSINIPFFNGKLILGTWQQIVFIDFDTRSRNRRVVIQFIGH